MRINKIKKKKKELEFIKRVFLLNSNFKYVSTIAGIGSNIYNNRIQFFRFLTSIIHANPLKALYLIFCLIWMQHKILVINMNICIISIIITFIITIIFIVF